MEPGTWEPELFCAQLYRQITHNLVEKKLYNLSKEEALYMNIFMMVRAFAELLQYFDWHTERVIY